MGRKQEKERVTDEERKDKGAADNDSCLVSLS